MDRFNLETLGIVSVVTLCICLLKDRNEGEERGKKEEGSKKKEKGSGKGTERSLESAILRSRSLVFRSVYISFAQMYSSLGGHFFLAETKTGNFQPVSFQTKR